MPQVTEEEHRALHPEKLRIYDAALGTYRDATQADLDALFNLAFIELSRKHTEEAAKLGCTLLRFDPKEVKNNAN